MTETARILPTGELVIQGTKCRRCLGDRFWKDWTGELQCWDCDPPAKIFREKIEAKKAEQARHQRSIVLLDQEEEDERLRREYTERTGKTS